MTRWSVFVYCAMFVGLGSATAAVAAPPPAISQYVEQLPAAGGSKATSGPVSSSSVPGTQARPHQAAGSGSATETTAGGKRTAGRRAHETPKRGLVTPTDAVVTPTDPSPLHAVLATSDNSAGLGRGALVALVLLGATVIAAAGLVLRRGRVRLR